MKYTNDDILYYFSEFTDNFEYTYDVERTSSFDPKNVGFCFNFRNENIDLSKADGYISFGKEMEIFNKCFKNFSNIEEDIIKVDHKQMKEIGK
jgi:hypothetical protein